MNKIKILENGYVYDGPLPLGAVIPTQWGPRKVVEIVQGSPAPIDHITSAERECDVQ